jgi:hypothetical protein
VFFLFEALESRHSISIETDVISSDLCLSKTIVSSLKVLLAGFISAVFYLSSSMKRARKSAFALSSYSLFIKFLPCKDSASLRVTVFSTSDDF